MFVAWLVAGRYAAYLPPPSDVLAEAAVLLREPSTYRDIAVSMVRLVVGLGTGFLLAVAVALAMRASPWWERFFGVYVYVAASLPSLAAALFAYMIFGRSELGVYAAVAVIVFPYVVFNLSEGLHGIDRGLSEMASVYRFDRWRRLRHVVLPQLAPELSSALRNSYALAWKLVVVAEVFSQDNGIGYQYRRAYGFFDVDALAAWIAFFLVAVFAVEYGLMRPVDRWMFRWRAW